MRHALVTGSSGFLGTALVRRLVDAGDQRLRLHVRSEAGAARVRAIAPDADVTTRPPAEALDGVDVVYHLAAGTRDGFTAGVALTRELVAAAGTRPTPPKLVLVSSFSVYGVAALERGAVVDERTPLEPHPERRDAYAQAKLEQERLCWDSGLPLVVV